MKYQTIYTILEDAPRVPWSHVAIGVIAALLFVWGVSLVVRGLVERRSAIVFLVFAGAWVFFWNATLLPSSWNIYRNHARFAERLRSGNCEVVEGTVDDFHPMPHHGHSSESFTVNGVRFEYSDFDDSKPGFNRTLSHGGPIHGGMQVRIHHHDGSILQIEVPKAGE